MSHAPNLTKKWVSKEDSNITADSLEEANDLRLANPNNSVYRFWCQVIEADLEHEYEDEEPSTKPDRILNDNKV
jgi:hypothetical protein